jgi:hypothetical protein
MPTLLEVMKIPNTRTDLDGSVLCAEENGMLTFHGQSKPIISEILMENRGLERSVIDKDCAYIGAVRWLTPNECSKVAFLEKDQLVQIKKHGFPVSDIWGPVTHEAFYDLAADPGERKPLEREARPAFAELRNVYTNYMNVCKGVTGGVEKQPAAK